MQALDLDVPLLSDWNAEATHGFGVAFEHRGMKDVSARSAFLIDRDGVVRGARAYETAEVPDFAELLDAARELPRALSSSDRSCLLRLMETSTAAPGCARRPSA